RRLSMIEPDRETTAGGLAGKLAGRVKEAAGRLLGDETFAREGRLQETSADADRQAREAEAEARTEAEEARVAEESATTEEERQRLETEIAAEDAERRIERERFVKEAAAARAEAVADTVDP